MFIVNIVLVSMLFFGGFFIKGCGHLPKPKLPHHSISVAPSLMLPSWPDRQVAQARVAEKGRAH